MRHPRDPRPSTPATIADRDDVIAVFLFTVPADDQHTLAAEYGALAPSWRNAAQRLAEMVDHAGVTERAIVRVDDAQVLYYTRHEPTSRALVVVMPHASDFMKSAARCAKTAMVNLDGPRKRRSKTT